MQFFDGVRASPCGGNECCTAGAIFGIERQRMDKQKSGHLSIVVCTVLVLTIAGLMQFEGLLPSDVDSAGLLGLLALCAIFSLAFLTFRIRSQRRSDRISPANDVQDVHVAREQDWEREIVRSAIEIGFAEHHHNAVLTDLMKMRSELLLELGSVKIDRMKLLRFVVRAQLLAIEQAAGDPAFFTARRYNHPDCQGVSMDETRLSALDRFIKGRQLLAKDVDSLIEMLDVDEDRMDVLTALAKKGREASSAVPHLLRLLKTSDQLRCCKVLRTLEEIGLDAQAALPAAIDLANDPDEFISRQARAAVRAIDPEQSAAFGMSEQGV